MRMLYSLHRERHTQTMIIEQQQQEELVMMLINNLHLRVVVLVPLQLLLY